MARHITAPTPSRRVRAARRRLRPFAALLALLAAAPAAAQEQIERRLLVGEQITLEPGYPVGDVTVTDVRVADYRVLPGRARLLLLGRSAGQTLLNLTDQRRALRTVATIIVESRELHDLREQLKAYPSVSLQQLGAKAIVTGAVTSKRELDVIARMAQTAGAQSAVTLEAPEPAPAPAATGAAPATPAAPTELEFEVDILEASVAFESGSYATGVEPSGRRLFQQVVRVPVGGGAELFVPAAALGEAVQKQVREQARASKGDGAPVGIRIRLEPSAPTRKDQFSTFVLVETNVPVEQARDTAIMRRARWELESAPGDPFALAGGQLLAVPDALRGGGSKFGRVLRTAGTVARLPGVRGTPAPQYTTGIPYYDRKKKTQLLALFKPREVAKP